MTGQKNTVAYLWIINLQDMKIFLDEQENGWEDIYIFIKTISPIKKKKTNLHIFLNAFK